MRSPEAMRAEEDRLLRTVAVMVWAFGVILGIAIGRLLAKWLLV